MILVFIFESLVYFVFHNEINAQCLVAYKSCQVMVLEVESPNTKVVALVMIHELHHTMEDVIVVGAHLSWWEHIYDGSTSERESLPYVTTVGAHLCWEHIYGGSTSERENLRYVIMVGAYLGDSSLHRTGGGWFLLLIFLVKNTHLYLSLHARCVAFST